MNEYIRVYDSTDDLSEVNTYATEGWRVIASFNDDRRGQMFIMEREVKPAPMTAEKHHQQVEIPRALREMTVLT